MTKPHMLVLAAVWVGCADPTPSPPDLSSLPPLPAAPTAVEPPRGVEAETRELVLALVGEVRGEIEPCGCPTLPYGGFARRGRLLDELRAETPSLFHLDAGELLLKGRATTRSEDRDRRADLMLELSAAVGLDAWTPGPSDLLALGPDGLRAVAAGTLVAPPAVSATLASLDGALLLPASRVVRKNGVSVAIIGVSPQPQGRELRAVFQALPPGPATQAALDALPDDIDLVVALGPLDDEEADDLALTVPDLDLILTTRGETVDAPHRPRPGGPLVVETPDRGRYLQLVELRLASDRQQPLVEQPPAAMWRTLATTRSQAAQARATNSTRLGEREAALAAAEAAFAEVGRGRNLVRIATRPLGKDLDPPSAHASERPQARGTLAERIAGFKVESIDRATQAAAQPPPPGQDRYASSGACVNCHTQEFFRWSFSDHSKAWQTLLSKKETDNPECVGCHTTAFGKPGGFGELTDANTRKWKAVQCEACHGPLLGHPDDPTVTGHPVTEAACIGCHDEANSPNFDYATYVLRASCQAHEIAPAPAP